MAQDNLLELEIGAFMGPHIKRARIVLVIVGVLYAVWGYLNYSDIAQLHEDRSVHQTEPFTTPQVAAVNA